MWAHKYIHSCFADSFGQVVLVTKLVVSALWLTIQYGIGRHYKLSTVMIVC